MQDRNGDGVKVLMAYALNKSPLARLTDQLPATELNGNILSLQYYAGSQGVTYRVKFSKDMIGWVTTGISISDPDANGIRTASVDQGEDLGFLRLEVEGN